MSEYFGQGKYPLKEGHTFDGGLALSWGLWSPPESVNDEDTRPRFSVTTPGYMGAVIEDAPVKSLKRTLTLVKRSDKSDKVEECKTV